MKFVADSSMPHPSVAEIRALGNEVETIDADPDDDLERALRRAVQRERILLTFELTVHDLVFDGDVEAPPGIVCFQFEYDTPRDPAHLFSAVIGEVKEDESTLELEGFLTLLEAESLRQKPL
jgi:hypothetical protein